MDINVTVPVGEFREIMGGDFIYCRSASHDVFDIQPEGGERIEFHTGAQERFAAPARQFRVHNEGVAALTASFRVKNGGEYRDNRFVLSGGIDVNLAAAFTTAAVVVGVVAGVVIAANAARKSVTIQNLGAFPIYIGGAAVTVADGLEIASGGAFTLSGVSAAVYAISGTAGQDVRILQEG